MKKRVLFLISFIFLSSSFCFAQETVTITTYYPAPYGVYQQMRLFPVNGNAFTCDATHRGEMYYHDDTAPRAAGLYYCNGTSWMAAGGGGNWTLDTASTPNNLYLSAPDANTQVGIGVANPGLNDARIKLEVQGGAIQATGGLIIETRTSDPGTPVVGQIWLRTDL
ncbi:MAG: hypothetical protein FJZ10_04000 [Candidatus Omnitrophica bacterium]|nr:hypothetical protein [Candidatus Omnitrophota bacterium]